MGDKTSLSTDPTAPISLVVVVVTTVVGDFHILYPDDMRGFSRIPLRTGDSLGSEVVKSILDRSTSVNIPHRSDETGSTVRGDLITLPFRWGRSLPLYPRRGRH